LQGALYPLKEAVLKTSRTGVTVTPALLHSVANHAEAEKTWDALRDAIAAKVDAISKLNFPFLSGNCVRGALCRHDDLLGQVRQRVSLGGEKSVAATRTFAESYTDRSSILKLIANTCERVRPLDPIDGVARNRLAGHIATLSAMCADYVAARDAT